MLSCPFSHARSCFCAHFLQQPQQQPACAHLPSHSSTPNPSACSSRGRSHTLPAAPHAAVPAQHGRPYSGKAAQQPPPGHTPPLLHQAPPRAQQPAVPTAAGPLSAEPGRAGTPGPTHKRPRLQQPPAAATCSAAPMAGPLNASSSHNCRSSSKSSGDSSRMGDGHPASALTAAYLAAAACEAQQAAPPSTMPPAISVPAQPGVLRGRSALAQQPLPPQQQQPQPPQGQRLNAQAPQAKAMHAATRGRRTTSWHRPTVPEPPQPQLQPQRHANQQPQQQQQLLQQHQEHLQPQPQQLQQRHKEQPAPASLVAKTPSRPAPYVRCKANQLLRTRPPAAAAASEAALTAARRAVVSGTPSAADAAAATSTPKTQRPKVRLGFWGFRGLGGGGRGSSVLQGKWKVCCVLLLRRSRTRGGGWGLGLGQGRILRAVLIVEGGLSSILD